MINEMFLLQDALVGVVNQSGAARNFVHVSGKEKERKRNRGLGRSKIMLLLGNVLQHVLHISGIMYRLV